MSTAIISTLVGLFCTSVSSIITFLLTRRKYNEEVNSQQIKNMNESFETYKKMMTETLALQNDKITIQDGTIKQLQEENSDLRKQLHNLQIQVAQMVSAVGYDTISKLKDVELMNIMTNTKPE